MSVLLRRESFDHESAFLAALAAQLPAGEAVAERTVELCAANLRGHCGEELDRIAPHVEEHLDFWTALAECTSSQLARLCRAELLLHKGDRDRALEEFLDALECDPSLVGFRSELAELARERAGEAWLRHRLVILRAALAGQRPDGAEGRVGDETDDGADDDHVRELYCELLEEYRADPEALARIRELGALIDEAVDRGDLPRAIVRRAPRP